MFYGYSNNFSDSLKIARKKPLAWKFFASADKALAPVSEKLFGPSDTSRINERKWCVHRSPGFDNIDETKIQHR